MALKSLAESIPLVLAKIPAAVAAGIAAAIIANLGQDTEPCVPAASPAGTVTLTPGTTPQIPPV